MMKSWRREPQILALEAEKGGASEHLMAAKVGQKGLTSAEWPMREQVLAHLATQDGTFSLIADRPPGILRAFRARKRVPIDIRQESPTDGGGSYVSAVLFISATGDPEKAGVMLDGFIQSLAREDFPKLGSVLLVVTDALSLFRFAVPPIDAVDAWNFAKTGRPVTLAPAVLAGERDHWVVPLGRFDRMLGNRMDRLREILASADIAFDFYPVSKHGFRATTGECIVHAPTPSGRVSGAVPFNLFSMAHMIALTLEDDLFLGLSRSSS